MDVTVMAFSLSTFDDRTLLEFLKELREAIEAIPLDRRDTARVTLEAEDYASFRITYQRPPSPEEIEAKKRREREAEERERQTYLQLKRKYGE